MMVDFAALGECMAELWANDPLETATVLRRGFGGDTLNATAAAAKMGVRTAYITALGDDPFGAHIRAGLLGLGIDTTKIVAKPGRNTGLYLVDVDSEGERRFHYYRAGSAASAFEPEDLDLDWLRRLRMLHVSGISQAISPTMRAAVRLAAETVAEAGGMVSFDTNYRPRLWPSPAAAREALEELPSPSLFAPSESDLEVLYAGETIETLAARFRQRGSQVVLVKAGDRGSYLDSDEHAGWVPAPRVRRVRDTTAAGDAAVGVMAAGILRGVPLRQAALLANRAAAFAVRRRGSVASLPSAKDIGFPA
jgi:2-dehydro-3-deoxygluconokinase